MLNHWTRHKPICNKHTCYCLDEEQGDPMCDCDEPAWRCRCEESSEFTDPIGVDFDMFVND
jgi:hypothetical protein